MALFAHPTKKVNRVHSFLRGASKLCTKPRSRNALPRKGTMERVALSERGAFKILSFLARGTRVQAGTPDMAYGPTARLRQIYSY